MEESHYHMTTSSNHNTGEGETESEEQSKSAVSQEKATAIFWTFIFFMSISFGTFIMAYQPVPKWAEHCERQECYALECEVQQETAQILSRDVSGDLPEDCSEWAEEKASGFHF